MKNKLPTVSIGIPALNEEMNIKSLLKNLLNQRVQGFILKEIIVISDGSTDRTEEETLSIRNNKVRLLVNKKRIGQALSQNRIIRVNQSDMLVLLNADVLPKNRTFLKEIIKPILENKKVGLVGAKVEPVGSETFVGEIIDFSAEIKQKLYSQKKGGHNIYNCHGRARAFSKAFLKNFKWKKTVGEDAFSYFFCINSGFDFYYQPNAVVLYKSPQTLEDHMKQSIRFMQSHGQMERLFDPGLVRTEYALSPIEFVVEVSKFIIKNPILFSFYCLFYISAQIKSRVGSVTEVTWDVSQSSKVVAR